MSDYQKVLKEIAAGGVLVIDGATGTELQRRGVPMQQRAWCAPATATHPQVVQAVHEDYIKAGARLITANTFASSREILQPLGLEAQFFEWNKQSVALAVAARERLAPQQPVLVAGGISPVRPTRVGEWLPTYSDVAKFEADCTEMAAIHKAAGADLIMAEMLCDSVFSPCVVRAAKANDLPVWIGLSARQNDDGTVVSFADKTITFNDILPSILAEGGDVVGIMHTAAAVTLPALECLKRHWTGPLLACPDSLLMRKNEQDSLQLGEMMSEAEFVHYCLSWREAGVQALGACCGFTVSHITALNERLAS